MVRKSKLSPADRAKLAELQAKADKMSWAEICEGLGVPVATVLRLDDSALYQMAVLMVVHGRTAAEALLEVSEGDA